MPVPRLRVLLAEKGFSETGLTLRSLCAEAGWSLDLVFVHARPDLAQALQSHCPDVAFLQLSLLQPDAPSRLRVLHLSYPSIPFILFADSADIACAVSCLSMGANDLMLEGFMDVRTMARVLRSAFDGRPVETLEALPMPSSREMHSVVTLDAQPAPFPKQGATRDQALSVRIEKLDHLKVQMGDQAFERISQELAQTLRRAVRHKDLLVPVSLGKWLVYFSGIEEAAGTAILLRIRARLNSFRPSSACANHIVVSVTAEECVADVQPALSRLVTVDTGGPRSPEPPPDVV